MQKNFGLFKNSPEAEFEYLLNQFSSVNSAEQTNTYYKMQNAKLKHLYLLNDLNQFLSSLLTEKAFPNIFILNQLMLKLFKLRQNLLAQKIFHFIIKHQLQNQITYNTMIAQLGHLGITQKDVILQLFQQAKALNLTDTVTYNSMIHAMGKMNQADLAIDLFNEAKSYGKISLVSYSSMLYVLAKQKPVQLTLALKLFQEAKQLFPEKDSVLYANIILCIANSHAPNPILCQEIFEEAKSENLLNPYIISNTLFAYSKSKLNSFEPALKILEIAKNLNFHDAIAYANTLAVLAKSSKASATLGLKILNEAIYNGQIDTVVYACALDVFVNADDGLFDDARAIFLDAKARGMYNHVTYASYLQFLAKLSPPPLQHTLEIYEEAIKLAKVDSHIFSTTLLALSKIKDSPIEIAHHIFMQAIEKEELDSICIANLLMVYQNQTSSNQIAAKAIYDLAKSERLVNAVIISILLKIIHPHDPLIKDMFKHAESEQLLDEQLSFEFKALQKNAMMLGSFFNSAIEKSSKKENLLDNTPILNLRD